MPLEIDYLTEGASDGAVARKLITTAGFIPGRDYLAGTRRRGKNVFNERLAGLNAEVAHGNPALAIRDWDGEASCPGDLVGDLVARRHPRLTLRVAVYSIESWLMADRGAYARFFGVRLSGIPAQPESIQQPKQMLHNWIRTGEGRHFNRFASNRRRAGVPDWQIVGEFQTRFVDDAWNVTTAMQNGVAPSLNRAFAALKRMGTEAEATA